MSAIREDYHGEEAESIQRQVRDRRWTEGHAMASEARLVMALLAIREQLAEITNELRLLRGGE